MALPAAVRDTSGARSVDHVVIRFAGDSGDGMQLAGMQFTAESALAGNDIATLPDFPAEIRAPAGTLAGVSGFQLNFSSSEIFTAGDEPNVLVAMNPAALKANLDDVPPNGVIIVDREAFSEANLKRAGYTSNPLTDHSLDKFQVFQVDVTKLTTLGVARHRDSTTARCSAAATCSCSGCCRGSISGRSRAPSSWLEGRFKKTPDVLEANLKALKAGLQLRRDDRDVRQLLRSAGRRGSPRASIATSPATARPRWASSRRRCNAGTSAVPRLVSDYPRQRHPARTRRLQEFPGLHLPGRGRDRRRVRRRSARPSAVRSRSPRPRVPA